MKTVVSKFLEGAISCPSDQPKALTQRAIDRLSQFNVPVWNSVCEEIAYQTRIDYHDDCTIMIFDLKRIEHICEKAYQRQSLISDVQLLIVHGASRETINEITGAHYHEIARERANLDITLRSGRDHHVSEAEAEQIKTAWERHHADRVAIRLIRVSETIHIPLNSIWRIISPPS